VSGSLIDYLKVSNSFAAGLSVNHRLLCEGTFMGLDLSGGATTTNVDSTFHVTNCPINEIVRILQVGSPDSALEGNAAAAGYTWVKIKRAHPASTVTGQLVAIPTATKITIVNSVAKTNQRPNPPVTANGTYQDNVIQITRESYGVGEHLAQGGGIKTLLFQDGNAQLDLNYQLVEMRMMKTIEKAILNGRRYAAESGNESEYETG